MIHYLDSVIVIYTVEGHEPFAARARSHLAQLRAAGGRFAVSPLTRLECRVRPLRLKQFALLTDFDQFFASPEVAPLPMTPAVFERATHIRAIHGYKLGDALHLAAAVEAGCDVFLTNDLRLHAFPDLQLQLLP